ncbi:MAG: Smr/MutS family protein [Neisseria sp.]|nr:Smr/MutS family protein [Neisseria sp.]
MAGKKGDFQDILQDLGRQAKSEAERRARLEAEAARRRSEEVDFALLMADAVPLRDAGRREAHRDTSPILPRRGDGGQEDGEGFFYVGDGQWQDIPAAFSKNGQGRNDIKKLQSGYYDVVADVDLHGYSQDEAQKVLNEFVAFVQRRGVCGEIIHGSGLGSAGYQPKLKNLVRRWLMQHPDVLAYAEPHAGNDGAVRILLKRRRPGEDGGV